MKIRNKRTGEIKEISKDELLNYKLGGKLNKLGVKNSLWNNIRENAGSGKKPTPEMLEQERKIKSQYANGGQIIKDLPKMQYAGNAYPLSVPTRTDSLNLYNNAVEIGNYFDKHPDYQVVDTKKQDEEELRRAKQWLNSLNAWYKVVLTLNNPPDVIKSAKDEVNRAKASYDSLMSPLDATKGNKVGVDRFNANGRMVDLIKNGVITEDSTLPYNEYRNDINDNQYYQREQQNGTLNLDIPMQLFDKRINPDFKKQYLNELNHDGVLLYGYNPIFIKPYDLLTPEERIIVDEKNSTNTTTAPITRPLQEEIILPVRKNEIDNPQISKISQPIINIPTVSPPQKDYVTIKTGSSYRNPDTGAFEQKSFKIDKVTGKRITEPSFKNGGKVSSWEIIEDLPKAQNGRFTNPPIYVSDPKDPRLQMYSDSSNLYNSSNLNRVNALLSQGFKYDGKLVNLTETQKQQFQKDYQVNLNKGLQKILQSGNDGRVDTNVGGNKDTNAQYELMHGKIPPISIAPLYDSYWRHYPYLYTMEGVGEIGGQAYDKNEKNFKINPHYNVPNAKDKNGNVIRNFFSVPIYAKPNQPYILQTTPPILPPTPGSVIPVTNTTPITNTQEFVVNTPTVVDSTAVSTPKGYVTITTGSSYRNPDTGAFEQKTFKIDKTTGKRISEDTFKEVQKPGQSIALSPQFKNGGLYRMQDAGKAPSSDDSNTTTEVPFDNKTLSTSGDFSPEEIEKIDDFTRKESSEDGSSFINNYFLLTPEQKKRYDEQRKRYDEQREIDSYYDSLAKYEKAKTDWEKDKSYFTAPKDGIAFPSNYDDLSSFADYCDPHYGCSGAERRGSTGIIRNGDYSYKIEYFKKPKLSKELEKKIKERQLIQNNKDRQKQEEIKTTTSTDTKITPTVITNTDTKIPTTVVTNTDEKTTPTVIEHSTVNGPDKRYFTGISGSLYRNPRTGAFEHKVYKADGVTGKRLTESYFESDLTNSGSTPVFTADDPAYYSNHPDIYRIRTDSSKTWNPETKKFEAKTWIENKATGESVTDPSFSPVSTTPPESATPPTYTQYGNPSPTVPVSKIKTVQGEYKNGGKILNLGNIKRLPKAGNGLISDITSTLNPKNWGVPDYTDKYKTWNEAYSAAKKAGLSEIMWNKGPNPGRKNLDYAGTPAQEMKSYGITPEQRVFNPSTARKNLGRLNTEGGYDIQPSTVFKQLFSSKNPQVVHLADTGPDIEKDAFRLYLGLPQEKNSFTPSKYQKGAFEIVNYNQMLPEVLDENIENLIKTKGNPEKESIYGKHVYGEGNPTKPLGDYVMGKHTVKKGEDDKGEYIEYIDNWDLDSYKINTFSLLNKGSHNYNNKIGFKLSDYLNHNMLIPEEIDVNVAVGQIADMANKPFPIYGRVYYKDYGDGVKRKMYYTDNELKSFSTDKNNKNFNALDLQKELVNRGYKLPNSMQKDDDGNLKFDGIYGNETKKALQDFQNKKVEAPKMAVQKPGQSEALPPQFQKGGSTSEVTSDSVNGTTYSRTGTLGMDRNRLQRTVTPYTTKRDIKKNTPIPTSGQDIDFNNNYFYYKNYFKPAGTWGGGDTRESRSVKTTPTVPFEGDKHWNSEQFMLKPHLTNDYPELHTQDNTVKQNKNNVLADMYKYQMLNNPDQSQGKSFRQAKKYMRQEINPKINGEFLNAYNDGLPTSARTSMNPMLYYGDENQIINYNNYNRTQNDNPGFYENYKTVDYNELKKISKDYFKNYEDLSRRDANKKWKSWEEKAAIDEQQYNDPEYIAYMKDKKERIANGTYTKPLPYVRSDGLSDDEGFFKDNNLNFPYQSLIPPAKKPEQSVSKPVIKKSNIKIVPGGYKNGGKTKKSNWQIIEY